MSQQFFKFKFTELGVKQEEIEALLGFEKGTSPEPFNQYIGEVFEIAKKLENIEGCYILFDNISFDLENNTTFINNTTFFTEKIVTRELRKASTVAIFVCTAGLELENYSRQQMKLGNLPEGYIADLTGTIVVEAAVDKIQETLADKMKNMGLGITNRYGPGYCGWLVKEQQKLFSLLPKGICNINLAESSLMYPIKSVSGIIGIGKNLKQHAYTCNICDMKECIYLNRKHH